MRIHRKGSNCTIAPLDVPTTISIQIYYLPVFDLYIMNAAVMCLCTMLRRPTAYTRKCAAEDCNQTIRWIPEARDRKCTNGFARCNPVTTGPRITQRPSKILLRVEAFHTRIQQNTADAECSESSPTPLRGRHQGHLAEKSPYHGEKPR